MASSSKKYLDAKREREWPNLTRDIYEVKSVETGDYNCIAFASGDETKRWWPDPDNLCHWPIQMREETIECFVKMYEFLGYKKCEQNSSKYNPLFEKVAIYFDPVGTPWWPPNFPTHAAIQSACGIWKSKLGDYEDIEHFNLECLNGTSPHGLGACYGMPVQIMKRRRPVASAIIGFIKMTCRKLNIF